MNEAQYSVPRLLKEVPNQPTDACLQSNRWKSRFTLIFDQEGYSPAFFQEMWTQHRISCITYRKFPQEPWPEAWFEEVEVALPGGERVWMKLAEQGSWIGSGKHVGTGGPEAYLECSSDESDQYGV